MSSLLPVRRTKRNERGMTTAEYAVGTVAVLTFGGILIGIYKEPAIHDAILKFIDSMILFILNLIP